MRSNPAETQNNRDHFLLSWKCGLGTVSNVEHVHDMIAFVDGVDNSVDVRFLSEVQMAKAFVFGDDSATIGKSLQSIDCLGQTIEPSKCLVGGIHFYDCLLYTSPSPRDRTRSRMPSSA